jgi:RNA polymerase sigma-70 factor (ECF subfamily)
VFINTWNALPGFRGEASEKTWIYRITINTCLMWIRKEKKNPTTHSERSHNEPTIETDESHEQIEKLYHAIGQLEELDRLLIMMVLDELEYEEISRIVGITENNVRVKVHRIKQRLKTIMK